MDKKNTKAQNCNLIWDVLHDFEQILGGYIQNKSEKWGKFDFDRGLCALKYRKRGQIIY